jgi:hypothetical protein
MNSLALSVVLTPFDKRRTSFFFFRVLISVVGQTKNVLGKIDYLLAQAGTDKTKLLTASIWLKDIDRDFTAMNDGKQHSWWCGQRQRRRRTTPWLIALLLCKTATYKKPIPFALS